MFKRLSNSFWTLVSSPAKGSPDAQTYPKPAPQTALVSRHSDRAAPSRRITLDTHVRARRSMSPDQRVARWTGPDVSAGNKRKNEDANQDYVHSRRRKLSHRGSGLRSRRHKRPSRNVVLEDTKVEEDAGGSEYASDDNITLSQSRTGFSRSNGDVQGDLSDDFDIGDEIVVKSETNHTKREDSTIEIDGHEIRMVTPRRNPRHSDARLHSSSPEQTNDGVEDETTFIVDDAEYSRLSPNCRKVISLPQAQAARGVSVPDLQAAGWDDDHIALRQKIAMRGYEPLMPAYHKFEFRWLPDELFSANHHAFLDSHSGRNFHASKALERLFELGSRVRDCETPACTSTRPDQRIRRMIEEYAKWADNDSGLDASTTIPLFTIVNKRAGHPASALKRRALQKLNDLATRYRAAFTINRSIETATRSSASHSSSSNATLLTRPLPTLYAFVVCGTVITLCAWRPGEQPAMEPRPIVFFDMKLKDYDVWNALAIAIAVVHMRNMQEQIAEETGLGVRAAEAVDQGLIGNGVDDDDPDR